MKGRFGFASVDGSGRPLRAYLLDGTELRCGDRLLRLPQGRIAAGVASAEGRTYRLTEAVPSESVLTGACLIAGDTGFEIESAEGRSVTVRDYPVVDCEAIEILRSATWTA
jgi:hypothetical protein